MNKVIIRPATTDDLLKLREFEQGVIFAERPFDNTLKDDPIQYYDLEQKIINDGTHLIVAEFNGDLVACGYARIEKAKPYAKYNFYSYLGFMYVSPEYRGRGINQKIIDELTLWSQEQGVNMMHLDVFSENTAAIRAYQKAGFKKYLVEMRLDITTDNVV